MSEYCVVRLLRSYYFYAYDLLKSRLRADKIVLQYIPCPAPDNMVIYQEMEPEDATIATSPGFFINPPSEAIPQLTNHN